MRAEVSIVALIADGCNYGFESELDPNEKYDGNLIFINDSKRMVATGKDIYGDPLPKNNRRINQ